MSSICQIVIHPTTTSMLWDNNNTLRTKSDITVFIVCQNGEQLSENLSKQHIETTWNGSVRDRPIQFNLNKIFFIKKCISHVFFTLWAQLVLSVLSCCTLSFLLWNIFDRFSNGAWRPISWTHRRDWILEQTFS